MWCLRLNTGVLYPAFEAVTDALEKWKIMTAGEEIRSVHLEE